MYKYGLDEMPPWGQWLIFGLQWFVLTVPPLIIIGKVVATLHFTTIVDQILYLQRLSLVTGITLIIQILWGHRLPLIIGPSSVLLVGIVASQGSSIDAIYSSILLGGVLIILLAVTGLFGRLVKLFTPRVIAVILLLVAVTLTPTIMNLIVPAGSSAPFIASLSFALVMVFLTFLGHRFFTGIWKSTLVLWSLMAGWLAFLGLFGNQVRALEIPNWGIVFPSYPGIHFTFDPALVIAFTMCFLALSFNDLGSIQSVAELIKPSGMKSRITRGLSVTGLGNILSGLMGVIGSVNFSLSPGVIVSTGCASRFTLIPAALGLLLVAILPAFMGLIATIPSVAIGVVLIYIMSIQLAAGLQLAFSSIETSSFDTGLVIGLSLMLGIIVAFLPADVLDTLPAALRPLLGNGFLVGMVAALFMEHVIFPGGKSR